MWRLVTQCTSANNVLLLLQRFTPHNRPLEVRPGRINKKFELNYDYDVKGMILDYYSVCWCLVVWSPLDRY